MTNISLSDTLFINQPTSTPADVLSSSYQLQADVIKSRIDYIKSVIRSMPDPDTLADLERRLSVLKAEHIELERVASHLQRFAAPPPVHPSLSRKERDFS